MAHATRPAPCVFLAVAILLCSVLASPIPDGAAAAADAQVRDNDAQANAPTNIINCAAAAGQGNGLNNCSMPSVPSVPGGLPTPPTGLPTPPAFPDDYGVSQSVDCATAVGQGNGINNCSTIFAPPSGLSGLFGTRKE